MDLNKLSPQPGSKRPRKRVGRGIGSRLGKTCGRGQKGQKSRSGGNIPARFEGGQMPLIQRVPKRGFHNVFGKHIAIVNVGDLVRFDKGAVVDAEVLTQSGLVDKIGDGIKLLGSGDISHALTVRVNKVSAGAKAKIEAAGGTVELV